MYIVYRKVEYLPRIQSYIINYNYTYTSIQKME